MSFGTFSRGTQSFGTDEVSVSIAVGALVAQSAVIAGNGLSLSTGTGALTSQSSTVSGAGVSLSTATGGMAYGKKKRGMLVIPQKKVPQQIVEPVAPEHAQNVTVPAVTIEELLITPETPVNSFTDVMKAELKELIALQIALNAPMLREQVQGGVSVPIAQENALEVPSVASSVALMLAEAQAAIEIDQAKRVQWENEEEEMLLMLLLMEV